MADGVVVRLIREQDLARAERASAKLFFEAEESGRELGEAEVTFRTPEAAQQWIDRMRFLVRTDPGGCWVAEDGAGIAGFAFSQNRGRFGYLASYGVRTGLQGNGIGKRLLDATLAHAGDRPGMFSSTVHPAATRRYRTAGFLLYPQMRMVGTVDRATLPAITGLREGRADDAEWMDQLDVRLRGAGHGPDHEYLRNTTRLVVTRDRQTPGYVYIDDQGRATLLAAADPRTAQTLLWEALASSRAATRVNCITTGNHWAIDVGLAARLDLAQLGYLAVRGMPEPAPYLASGHFL
ncbi:GNAT family N-acetyltransferase [Amycolatopsis sp. NEAU-NG30]|uniref:GNAT family N-acetyltransferase n=1 Tax=Amycolatopsis melonis TaxID=3156488 RepID=A0ABV0L6P4_9PSEU